MTRTTVRLTLASAAAAVVLAAGCASTADKYEYAVRAENVEFDPVTNEMLRLFAYYPDQQVYERVYMGTYYWRTEDGAWKAGPQLPAQVKVTDEQAVFVELPTEKPYQFHGEVLANHPSREMLREQYAQHQELRELREAVAEAEAERKQREMFATVPTDTDR
mgnify:CR=1 FL=1